jgi:hypothetical protein
MAGLFEGDIPDNIPDFEYTAEEAAAAAQASADRAEEAAGRAETAADQTQALHDNVVIMHGDVETWYNDIAEVGQPVIVSATAPDVGAGRLWYSTTNGRTYIYLDDGDSLQWVETNPMGNGSGRGSLIISDTRPLETSEGFLWFNSIEGRLYIRYTDPSTTKTIWIAASPSDLNLNDDLRAILTSIGGADFVITSDGRSVQQVLDAAVLNVVNTVNGAEGDVVIDAASIGAEASGTAASLLAAHVSEEDPHPEYAKILKVDPVQQAALTPTDGDVVYNTESKTYYLYTQNDWSEMVAEVGNASIRVGSLLTPNNITTNLHGFVGDTATSHYYRFAGNYYANPNLRNFTLSPDGLLTFTGTGRPNSIVTVDLIVTFGKVINRPTDSYSVVAFKNNVAMGVPFSVHIDEFHLNNTVTASWQTILTNGDLIDFRIAQQSGQANNIVVQRLQANIR